YFRPGFVVVIVGCTLTGLSTIVVGLRYYCRFWRMGTLGVTDHLMLTAVVLTWGNTVVNYYQDDTSRRFRPTAFRDPAKRPKIEAALRGTLITWYIYRITYTIALLFVKLSILFFYRAIASQVTFRRLVNATITLLILYTFSVTIASIFQCENPSDAWSTAAYISQFDGVPGRAPRPKCFEPTRLWAATAAVNLFSDVVILLLPIPTLLSLRVPMNKRLALIGIFSIGIMAVAASCVRLWVMALWAESPYNSARFGADLLLWGQVETNSGIVSASVPFLRLVFRGRRRRREDTEEEGDKRAWVSPRLEGNPEAGGEGGGSEGSGARKMVGSMEFFDAEKGDDGGVAGGKGSPLWEGFITVPASLGSSASRDS
ncbi:uncharacterized protein EI97DRAFT_360239, partial [Westerdykella ornata]